MLKNITQGGNDSEWRNSNNLITHLEVILLYPRRVLLERLVADLHVIGPVLNIVLRENTIIVCGENTEYRFSSSFLLMRRKTVVSFLNRGAQQVKMRERALFFGVQFKTERGGGSFFFWLCGGLCWGPKNQYCLFRLRIAWPWRRCLSTEEREKDREKEQEWHGGITESRAPLV